MRARIGIKRTQSRVTLRAFHPFGVFEPPLRGCRTLTVYVENTDVPRTHWIQWCATRCMAAGELTLVFTDTSRLVRRRQREILSAAGNSIFLKF